MLNSCTKAIHWISPPFTCLPIGRSSIVPSNGACLPRLLHNSKMCHFDRREKSHAQLVYLIYTLDFSSFHLPADRQVLHCPIEWSLPTETIAQLQNVSFRPEGEIPCSTRILKLYMGFFLFSPACR